MTASHNVWVVDDDRSIRWVLEKALERAGFEVESFAEAEAALAKLDRKQPDVIVSDIRMPGMSGLQMLDRIHHSHPDLPVIIITAHSDLDSAVSAYHGGAFEYLPKPFDVHEAVEQVRRACQSGQRNVEAELERSAGSPEIIGEAKAMQEVFRAIGRLARSNITVLINGESGTGKELVAHALHRHSPRAAAPFVALNMAAIPRELMESELFGHERGAFTGAQNRRIGRFEQADGGTLFLDEIGDMPPDTQTRLLRVLSDQEFYRVGGTTPVKVDVRIITATHQNLEQLVREGRFREDLFHRLNVIRIHIPSLRERRDDIPLLMEHFLLKAAVELQVERKQLAADALEVLEHFKWPGNVRQLENAARWITVMASGKLVHAQDLPPEVLEPAGGTTETVALGADWSEQLRAWARQELVAGRKSLLDRAQPEFERVLAQVALEFTGGRKIEAADLLGWGRNTLTRKIRELGLDGDEQDSATSATDA